MRKDKIFDDLGLVANAMAGFVNDTRKIAMEKMDDIRRYKNITKRLDLIEARLARLESADDKGQGT